MEVAIASAARALIGTASKTLRLGVPTLELLFEVGRASRDEEPMNSDDEENAQDFATAEGNDDETPGCWGVGRMKQEGCAINSADDDDVRDLAPDADNDDEAA